MNDVDRAIDALLNSIYPTNLSVDMDELGWLSIKFDDRPLFDGTLTDMLYTFMCFSRVLDYRTAKKLLKLGRKL